MNRRLTASDLRGIWAGLPAMFTADDRVDEKAMRINAQRMVEAGAHGIYASGSTGEFYALSFDEFKFILEMLLQETQSADIPLQAAFGAPNTRDILKVIEYCAGLPIGAFQFPLPYWMVLTDKEVLQFFKDLHSAAPDLPLVHYNIPRAQRFLNSADYRKILEAVPNLVGVKYTFAGSNFGDLQEAVRLTEGKVSFFVGEDVLVPGMLVGARGCYSATIYTNPELQLRMYDLARGEKYSEAMRLQRRLNEYFAAEADFMRELGASYIDPVADKARGLASGCLIGSPACRKPYLGLDEDQVRQFREWMKKRFPEFMYPT